MHEEKIKFYAFRELSKKVQDKIIQKYQDDGTYMPYDWYKDVFDMFKDTMSETYGFDVDNIQFSGFWSQGDGASFTGEFVDNNKAIDMLLKKDTRLVNLLKEHVGSIEVIRVSHRYHHKYTVTASVEVTDWNGMTDAEADALENACLEIEKRLEVLKDTMCDQLYRELQEWYDNYNNEDFIRACLMDENDEDYLADGTYMI